MTSETHDVTKGDGFAVGNLDSIGEGPGFARCAASWRWLSSA